MVGLGTCAAGHHWTSLDLVDTFAKLREEQEAWLVEAGIAPILSKMTIFDEF